MSAVQSVLLVALIPVALVLGGYWLAVRLDGTTAAERLAVSMLAGIASFLWLISLVNLVLPISRVAAFLCLLPVAITLFGAKTRRALGADFETALKNRRIQAAAVLAAGFLLWLLWPLLSRPDVIFYDGGGSHDAFFWIVGAEHLKRVPYLQDPISDPQHPLYASVSAMTGWKPIWGRMGAEGLLALVSGVVGASPLKIYLAATAALFLPWLAGIFLIVRTFLTQRITGIAIGVLVLCQPLFVFFHVNANLPNLLGVLVGSGAVVGLERILRKPAKPGAWLVFLALMLHGAACAYPEILPAIALPSALLVLRAATGKTGSIVAFAMPSIAVAGAMLMNPVTSIRATNGLICAMQSVLHPENWPANFALLPLPARIPAVLTLTEWVGELSPPATVLWMIVLLAAAVLAIVRARDRFGAFALVTGGAAVLVLSLSTDFGYGWQKAVQFSAIFVAALLPVGAVSVLRWRPADLALGLALLSIYGFALQRHHVALHVAASVKFISREWYELRGFAREELREVALQIETESFDEPFFYTMWATYFIPDSRLYFTSHPSSAGYLRGSLGTASSLRPIPEVILRAKVPDSAFALWRGATVAVVRNDPSGVRPQL